MNISIYPPGTDVIIKYAKVNGYIDQVLIKKANVVMYGVVYYAEKIRQSVWVDYKEIEIMDNGQETIKIKGFGA